MLYGVRPLDPVSFVGGMAIFVAVTAVASFIPARRPPRSIPLTLFVPNDRERVVWRPNPVTRHMIAACNGERSWSKAAARHSGSVRSRPPRVFHAHRMPRRMRFSSPWPAIGQRQFRDGSAKRKCLPCRSRSFATASSRGAVPSASRTRGRTKPWTMTRCSPRVRIPSRCSPTAS